MTWLVSYPHNGVNVTTAVDADEHDERPAEREAGRLSRAHKTTATYWWADIEEPA